VVRTVTTEGWSEERALAIAAAVEGDSEHPVARGIREKATERNVELARVRDFEAIKGRGIRAHYDGQMVYVGGPRLIEMLDLSVPDALAQAQHEADQSGRAIVNLVVQQQIVTAFILADVVRAESKAAVDQLHAIGIQTVMLTGDSKAVAETVAHEIGIDLVFAEGLPENKEQKVAALQQQGKKVAMVATA
jgi:Cu2+-exporting ATPase